MRQEIYACVEGHCGGRSSYRYVGIVDAHHIEQQGRGQDRAASAEET